MECVRVIIIRHGKTKWNEIHKYLGSTDLPLSEMGRGQARTLFDTHTLPKPDVLFVSPKIRCRETAQILFPGIEQVVVDDLREVDFGVFEGRSHTEMRENPVYQAWVKTNCQGPIPGGESFPDSYARVIPAFTAALKQVPEDQLAVFVLHGGTIMNIIRGFVDNLSGDLLIDNCSPLICDWDGSRLTILNDFVPQTGGQFPTE
ncbi:MAG: histidine phosphatase family protein [Propionibacteriaceae bacterium]|jgi:alpha-ribazole phosphatase|nr:histidine phosphatase family protein [Propionibacteriaceae bacterium]